MEQKDQPTRTIRFQRADLAEELPEPGTYRSTITSARFCKSSQGNHMLVVTHWLTEIDQDHNPVSDYFVLEGASTNGMARARRRLVELYRACGLDPHQGDPITPEELINAQLDVRIGHDQWTGRKRLRVIGYRAAWLT